MQTDSLPLKIYLDTCCLSRLFDDQTETKIRQETEAIQWILSNIQEGAWQWISSSVLRNEVENNPNEIHRSQIESWLIEAHQDVTVGRIEGLRGKHLESISFKKADALHIACAESATVDVFLTTDDRLLKKAKSVQSHLYIQVDNPLEWLLKAIKNENT